MLILINLFSIITCDNILIGDHMNSEIKNNVPSWMLESETAPTEQNKEVDMIVAGYIGSFRKRGFSQLQIGSLMTSAFLLPLEEVEKRLDAVLSCAEDGDEESGRKLCVYLAQTGSLFSTEDTDPCEIIGILKEKYGKNAAFETLLTFPDILTSWKNSAVRDLPENEKFNLHAQKILSECASVFLEIG